MNLDKILNFDPISVAEKFGGDGTMALGLSILHSAKKQEILSGLGDTFLCNDLDRYLAIIESVGFRKAYELPFSCKMSFDNETRNEKQFAYWHDDGLFLIFDTYAETRVNIGNIYYNWIPESKDWHNYTESGGLWEKVWVGYHDCREALLFHMNRLRVHGKLLPQWIYTPSIWFCHHGDTNSFPKDWIFSGITGLIRDERIKLIPEDIRGKMNL